MKAITRDGQEMKYSGIEWIGEVPSTWRVCKTLYGLSMPITDGPHTTPELYAEGVPFVSAEAVSTGNGSIDFSHIRGYVSEEFYQECSKKYIPQREDIYMIKSGATTGKVSIVDTDRKFTIWSPLAVFRVNNERIISKYLFYYIQSEAYQKQVELNWSYGTQQNIGMRVLEQLKICMPVLDEQKNIANYLDDRCSKIDAIIAEAKASIEEYKELKQAVIYEAVTKGLDKNVEMKDSGIEWIGKIPKTWEKIRIKYVLQIENGSDPLMEGEIPVYGSGADSFKTCGEFKNGPTVLLGRKGATLHIPHYIEGKYWNVDTAFNTLIKFSQSINMKYFYYLATCFDYKRYMSQTTLPSMTQTAYNNMIIPYPSYSEQNKIVQYLEQKLQQICMVISQKQSLIEELESYKKSLIYEVVTGKRKVVE
ncbi:MAG: restriction endonuclease subunit S [Anaerovibrio sp.]|nr:restriction endonuclease subunit S [Anaerovibrio sp.]